jgi:hypothetical protein
MLFLSNKDQMYIPSFSRVFGSVMKQFQLDQNASVGNFQQFEITRTQWKALDQPSDRCNSTHDNPDTMACITEYIETECGCTIPLAKTNSDFPTCNETAQFQKLNDLTIKLVEADDNAIYNITGCISACNKNEYELKAITDLLPYDLPKHQLLLNIGFNSGRYIEKEQYVVYDTNSFVADVGGYMGLLLGHSLFSLYHNVARWYI